ncbi:hypothetical protein [Oleiagrimonas sp.]|uniref:hypothetical protein n=1 Tax=Oleiagrimonas sp. TaxID=2010330 RepID=UPI002621772B|nr:hypothetical protein [Oleiagrimonas sp.]MDA3915247.1 hypothetical protein [Oleiagrimonas sp.]
MNELEQKPRQMRPAQFAIIASMPVVFALLLVLFQQAPPSFLWFGLGLSIVALLLVRLLSGFAFFGRRRLHFGSSKPLRVWQTPILWMPVAIVAIFLVFRWFVA